MINPAIIPIIHPDGTNWNVIIEPVLEKTSEGITDTAEYKLYKVSADNQSSLSTEPLELDEKNDDLPDEKNPDFLGKIILQAEGPWTYEGDLLEQLQLKRIWEYIRDHQ